MTDPTKNLASAQDGNPFISLKNILEDEEFSNITMAELVLAIEKHCIYKYDSFGILRKCSDDSEQCREVMTLLRIFKNYDPYFNEEHGIQEYDPPPLDDVVNENFGRYPCEPETHPSQYNYYGWLNDGLPEFKAMPVSLNKDKPLGPKSEASYLRIIAALLEYIEGNAPGIDAHPKFTSEAKLIEYLVNQYDGHEGLSQSNLTHKFPIAKRMLKSK